MLKSGGYEEQPSIFDDITADDLIIAFFPCIYFCAMSQMAMYWGYTNYRKMTVKEKTDAILQRVAQREEFFGLAVKMLTIAQQRGLRMIMENPWSEQTYLKANFVMPPTLIDNDRTRRGDIYKKPTAYWFINCQPTDGQSYQRPREKVRTILDSKASSQAGICSEERSMITSDYARNFIHDFILGKPQKGLTQLSLFD